MKKPNDLLENDVRDELDWDASLDDTRIAIEAEDGHITLAGAVPTYVQWLDASDDAWSVSGVTAVDNELLVGLTGEAVADADVAARCIAALDSDLSVPHGAVTVGVADGWVTLGGRVHRFVGGDADR